MQVTPTAAAPINTSADTQSLLADVLLNISFTLHHALGRLRGAEPEAIRALMASLPTGLVSVTHMPGQRRISVCDGAACYTVKTITSSPKQPGESDGLFTGEQALLEWQEPQAGRKSADPLATPTSSAWHIMVLEMLYRRLDVWLTQHCPHARNDAFIRHTAKLAAQSIPAQAPLLNTVLYDAMGGAARSSRLVRQARSARQPADARDHEECAVVQLVGARAMARHVAQAVSAGCRRPLSGHQCRGRSLVGS